jgi:hypothetical protein
MVSDCKLAAPPAIRLRNRRGRLLPAARQAPVCMHPGPVMRPVRLAVGHRAATDPRWISNPVYPSNRTLVAARVTVDIGAGRLSAPLAATLYSAAGKAVGSDQTPLRAAEEMAAH